MLRLIIISCLFFSCKGNNTQMAIAESSSYQKQAVHVNSDSLLVGIQDKIYKAFVQSILSKDKQTLVAIGKELEGLNKTKKQNIILYWRSYLQLYSSICYLQNGDKATSEKEVDKGIAWLNNMKKKNSEDYALLARLQSFGIQFKGMRAMFISGTIKKNLKQAIAIDSTNIRAYFVYASSDFYTPEKYGGGKEAEKYLLKAISLPEQKVKNEYLPSWGKDESYELLISLYIKAEKWELAKKYFKDGIEKYPESYMINKLAAQLISK